MFRRPLEGAPRLSGVRVAGEVEIHIQGSRYVVRSDEDRDELVRVARYVDEKLADLSRGRGASYPHAVLACLNIASELFAARAELRDLRTKVTTSCDDLVSGADRAIAAILGADARVD